MMCQLGAPHVAGVPEKGGTGFGCLLMRGRWMGLPRLEQRRFAVNLVLQLTRGGYEPGFRAIFSEGHCAPRENPAHIRVGRP